MNPLERGIKSVGETINTLRYNHRYSVERRDQIDELFDQYFMAIAGYFGENAAERLAPLQPSAFQLRQMIGLYTAVKEMQVRVLEKKVKVNFASAILEKSYAPENDAPSVRPIYEGRLSLPTEVGSAYIFNMLNPQEGGLHFLITPKKYDLGSFPVDNTTTLHLAKDRLALQKDTKSPDGSVETETSHYRALVGFRLPGDEESRWIYGQNIPSQIRKKTRSAVPSLSPRLAPEGINI